MQRCAQAALGALQAAPTMRGVRGCWRGAARAFAQDAPPPRPLPPPPPASVPACSTQARSERLATLYGALARHDPAAVYDAFLDVEALRTPLAAAEYRHILQVLLTAQPHTRQATNQILVLIEHVKRTYKLYAHATAPTDVLVRDELTALLQDAYLWNALLSSARGRQRRLPLGSLVELLELFVAAECAVPAGVRMDAAAHKASAPRTAAYVRPIFPNVVSFNILLHAIVRSMPSEVGRSRAPITSFATVRREIQAGRYTRADAEAFFAYVWTRLCVVCTPTAPSWATHVLFYAQLQRLDKVQACLRASVAAQACSIAAVNTALDAYAAAYRQDPTMPARLAGVYEALRHHVLLAERGQALPREPDRAMQRVLGVPRLPRTVLPDRGTYALMIRHQTLRGDLNGALRVLHDMVVTPGTPALHASDAHGMAPSTDVYHAFFAAFARFGVPARVRQSGATPSAWVWEVPPAALWNVYTLTELFEGYLRVHPVHTPPRRLPRAASRGAVSRPARAPAPSPAQLRHVLAALLRVGVGHAHHAWVEAQWLRLVDKFADATSWYAFRAEEAERMLLETLRS